MNDHDLTPVPPDDTQRSLTFARPDDPSLTHLAVVGDTYTVLVDGEQTAGRYALIDMLIPPGGGPPPHRHVFEELFHVLEGEIELELRNQRHRARAGETVNIPANAPHAFRNATEAPARVLCFVAPAGLEAYFGEWGDRVATRTALAPELSESEFAQRMEQAVALAPKYGIEVAPPPGAAVADA